jgi:hypothetical protein
VDVWNGSVAQVQIYVARGNVTYPIGLRAGQVAAQWGVDRSSFAVVDTLGIVRFITSNSTSYRNRYTQNEAAIIAALQNLTTVVERLQETAPRHFSLGQSFPNPFRQETTIRFEIAAAPKAGHVRLSIYNLLGQQVRLLISQHLPAGAYQSVWNGRDAAGNLVPGGLYFYKLEAGSFVALKRLVFLREGGEIQ